MFRKSATLFFTMFVICLISQSSFAAENLDYPKKGRVLTIIVPYSAGGGADTDARIIAPLLEKKMGVRHR